MEIEELKKRVEKLEEENRKLKADLMINVLANKELMKYILLKFYDRIYALFLVRYNIINRKNIENRDKIIRLLEGIGNDFQAMDYAILNYEELRNKNVMQLLEEFILEVPRIIEEYIVKNAGD